MGVVHHANYLRYLEDARTHLLRERALPYGDIERTGVGLPVRSVALQYRSPAFFEDVLVVACWIERTRAASVTFGYEIHRRVDGERGPLLMTAELELACIDLASRRPRPFPDELRSFFIEEPTSD